MKGKELLKKELKFKVILETRLRLNSKTNKDVTDKTDKYVKDLRKTKKDFNRCFNRLIEEVESKANETKTQLYKEIEVMKSNIMDLKSIEENLEAEDATNPGTITNYRETVGEIIENNKPNISGVKSFKFPVFNTDGFFAEMVSKLMTREEYVILQDCEDADREITKPLPAPISQYHATSTHTPCRKSTQL